jgi:thymidine kinase
MAYMAQLYFYYSAMNAGKTTRLLQSAFNYEEMGLKVLCFLPEEMVASTGTAVIASRVGMSRPATILTKDLDIMEHVQKHQEETGEKISCIFLDEVQFLKKSQVMSLCQIVDQFKIPVLAYGLRSDFQGRLFEGSQWLLAWADKLIEVKAVCFCGKKAVMTARIHSDGTAIQEGPQVHILGSSVGNDIYTSLCRKHYRQLFHDQVAIQDLRTHPTL